MPANPTLPSDPMQHTIGVRVHRKTMKRQLIWFWRATENGDAVAQHRLAVIHAGGCGVLQDMQETNCRRQVILIFADQVLTVVVENGFWLDELVISTVDLFKREVKPPDTGCGGVIDPLP